MTLSHAYSKALVQALSGKEKEVQQTIIDTFFRVLEKKGHTKLLPAILAVIRQSRAEERQHQAVLKIADTKDTPQALESLKTYIGDDGESVRVVIDGTLIGGYVYDAGTVIIDNSYKKHLLSLYTSLTI